MKKYDFAAPIELIGLEIIGLSSQTGHRISTKSSPFYQWALLVLRQLSDLTEVEVALENICAPPSTAIIGPPIRMNQSKMYQ